MYKSSCLRGEKELSKLFFSFWSGKIGKFRSASDTRNGSRWYLAGTLVEAYQDAGYIFYILNCYPSRVTADIMISTQTQVTGRYVGETGISTPFFRTVGWNFDTWFATLTSRHSKGDLVCRFFFGDIGQNLERVLKKTLVTPRKKQKWKGPPSNLFVNSSVNATRSFSFYLAKTVC